MTQQSEMDALVGRTEKLVGALTNAILSTAEVAAERIELASRVAQVQQRMSAFGAVLESVGAQKAALLDRMDASPPAVRRLLEYQVAALTAQEVAILERAGVPQEAARLALAEAYAPDGAAPPAERQATHRRDGKRFVRVAGVGTCDGAGGVNGVNGAAGDHGEE